MPEIILAEPHFTVDPRAEQYTNDKHGIAVGEAVFCLQALQRGINTSPEAYLSVLTGEVTPGDQDAEARKIIETVLGGAILDRFIVYDEESDDAITSHPDYKLASSVYTGSSDYTASKRGLGSERVRKSNPKEGGRGDAVRTTVLRLYVQRVIHWKTQQEQAEKGSETELRKAS